MSKEVCEYRVSLRGRPVGSYRLTSLRKHNTVLLEAQLDLQGPLGRKSVHQSSRIQQESWVSLEFVETYRSGAELRTFEVVFDQDTGMVTARKGTRDEASVPYIQAYRDPLSIFYELRQTATERLHMPLIGKDVVLEHVSDVTLETSLGSKRALVYSCQPGGNYIYIEDNKDRTILKLSQRMDGQMLEAGLVKVSYEAESHKPERHTRKRRTGGGVARQPRVQHAGRQPSSQRSSRQRASQSSRYQDNQQSDGQQNTRTGSSQQRNSQQRNSQQRSSRRNSSQQNSSRQSSSQQSSSRQSSSQQRDNSSQSSGSQRRQRSQRKQDKPSSRRRNRSSQQQGTSENTQNTAASEQQPQTSSATKKRGGARRNRPSRRPNRSRKDNSKSREDAE